MPSVFTPSQITALRVLCTVFPSLIVGTTIGRLCIKGYKRWSLDDLFITLGMLVMAEQQIVIWSLSIFEPPTLPVFYTVITSSATQIWLARASILSSIYHIAPTPASKKLTMWSAVLMLTFYLVSVAQQFWVCQTNLQYDPQGDPRCVITIQVPIFQFCAALISDSLLIGLPLHTLRLLRRHHRLRRRLQVIFAASAIITMASLVDSIANFLNLGFGLFVAVEMECWVSLLLCNLPILHSAACKYANDETVVLSTFEMNTPSDGRTESSGPSKVDFSAINFASSPSQSNLSSKYGTTGTFEDIEGDESIIRTKS